MFNSKSLIVLLLIGLVALSAVALAGGPQIGRAKFTINEPMVIGGTELKAGQYEVEWQTHSPEADVVFKAKGKVAAQAQGKLVGTEKKFDYNTVLSGKDSSGREALRELQVAGKKIKIVF